MVYYISCCVYDIVNKNTLGAKKWHGPEKKQLKGVIWECGQD